MSSESSSDSSETSNSSVDSVLSERRSTLEDLVLEDTDVHFCNLTSYKGEWNALGMSGHGVFTFGHNVTFEGTFDDSQFVKGVYHYPLDQTVRNTFMCDDGKFKFSDGLPYEDENWDYCCGSDRRYFVSKQKGFSGSRRERVTSDGYLRPIPPGMYDTLDGFYNPKTRCVVSAVSGSILRLPTADEEKWIMEHCRKGGDEAVGYKPELYERWTTGARNKETGSLICLEDDDVTWTSTTES